MNLNNISHPGRPGPEELVPSRYAVRIGEIDVLVVGDGVLPLPTKMLGHNADPAVRAAWLNDMFLPPDAFDWSLNAVVVRSGDQTILIDAGLGLDPDLNLPRAGQLRLLDMHERQTWRRASHDARTGDIEQGRRDDEVHAGAFELPREPAQHLRCHARPRRDRNGVGVDVGNHPQQIREGAEDRGVPDRLQAPWLGQADTDQVQSEVGLLCELGGERLDSVPATDSDQTVLESTTLPSAVQPLALAVPA